jgi:Anti-sigma factor NepR
MENRIEPMPQDRKAWLLEIARRLRADYEALLEPVPPRFAALIEQLEVPAKPSGREHRKAVGRNATP